MSSFLLTIDNAILKQGEAFSSGSGRFYPISGNAYGLYIYASPYRQLVNDASISGSVIVSGLYVSGNFVRPGQSGLVSLNVAEGLAYFSYQPTNVSGTFSVKEINVYLNSEPEEKLLFETKMSLKPKFPQIITGMGISQQSYPVVFLKPIDTHNEPLCFGGVDSKNYRLRAIVLAETQYQLTATCNILENLAHRNVPLINVTGLPFDALGGYTGAPYNYTGATGSVPDAAYLYVAQAKSSMLMSARELNQLNPTIFPAFVDFELWTIQGP
jgi:hypothetical protein